MERIEIVLRTTKKTGAIRLRFRLWDGRKVQLYHKSDIVAPIEAMSKFTSDGQIKPRVTVYDQTLFDNISKEISAMHTAYRELVDKGATISDESFNSAVFAILHPEANQKEQDGVDNTLLSRLRDYTIKASDEGVIGKSRLEKYTILIDKMKRFLSIKHREAIIIHQFDCDLLLDFRAFLFDEYLFVEKYARLYEDMPKRSIPTKRLSQNTVATNLKILQTFFNELEEAGEVERSPFKGMGRKRRGAILKEQYDSPVYLEKKEFLRVLRSNVPATLASTKDAFLFQCAIGFRISDFQNLSMNNISVSPEGIPYVHYLPIKTLGAERERTELETPLVRFAFDILKRNNCEFPILRYVTGENGYNAKIKQLLSFCKINRKVQQYNEETETSEYIPISSLGSSKLCRSTHVDMLNKVQVNMYAAGLHKVGSNAVTRYTKLELKDRFSLMNYAFSQKPYKVDENLNIL